MSQLLWRYQVAGNQHLRYQYEVHGNVTALLDGGGHGLERYSYGAFGTATVTNWDGSGARPTSNYGNRFLFQGREYFPQYGIYDYRHRMYQPELGRFLQADPTGFDAGDVNLFRYCADDPVDHGDPTGLQVSLGEAERRPGTYDISFDSGIHGSTSGGSLVTSAILAAQWGGSNVSLALVSKGGNGKNFENSAHGRAVQMLGEETHRPDVTQTGLITDGPPYRIGPKDEKIVRSNPMDLDSKRVAREEMPAIKRGQEALVIHYHSRTGPRFGPPSEIPDLQTVKTRTMYFTNKEWAATGKYLIYRRGQTDPEVHFSQSLEPSH
ncbi:MAG: RHS repeat-associated core domain-containing protein [Chthoniobacterales bacterium]